MNAANDNCYRRGFYENLPCTPACGMCPSDTWHSYYPHRPASGSPAAPLTARPRTRCLSPRRSWRPGERPNRMTSIPAFQTYLCELYSRGLVRPARVETEELKALVLPQAETLTFNPLAEVVMICWKTTVWHGMPDVIIVAFSRVHQRSAVLST